MMAVRKMSGIGSIGDQSTGLLRSTGTGQSGSLLNGISQDTRQGLLQLLAMLEDLLTNLSTSRMPFSQMPQCHCASSSTTGGMQGFMDNLASELDAVTSRMSGSSTTSGPIVTNESQAPNISLLDAPLSGGSKAVRFGLGSTTR